MRRSLFLGGAVVLNHRSDGSCVFLTKGGLCRIPAKFWADSKPFMCRQFPLQVVRTDREVLATMVRSCPSAAADRGRKLGEHLGFLKRLLGEGEFSEGPAPPIAGRTRRSWDDFYRVLEACGQL